MSRYETFNSPDEAEADMLLSAHELSLTKTWSEVEEIESGCEYGACPEFTAIIDRMDTARTVRELGAVGELIRQHDATCSHLKAVRAGIAPELAAYQGAECVACGSGKAAVVTERLLAHRPAAVCCMEAARIGVASESGRELKAEVA